MKMENLRLRKQFRSFFMVLLLLQKAKVALSQVAIKDELQQLLNP